MRVWGDEPQDARELAARMGIEHYVADERIPFKETIVKNFIDEYKQGRTPNPCVMCNPLFKFRVLAEWADKLDCAYIATGHYSRLEERSGHIYIVAGDDDKKDQSYFLWRLGQDILKRCIFPLGDYTKIKVREYLAEKGYEAKSKEGESMEVCFIQGDYRDFLREQCPELDMEIGPGWFVNSEGVKLGQHKGAPYYTIGQRKGLEIALGKPAYVLKINPQKNTVMLGDAEQLQTEYMLAEQDQIVDEQELFSCENLAVRIRYRSRPMNELLDEASELASAGVKELIVIAQDITRYGTDLNGEHQLAALLRELCKLDFHWIRLHYLYPDDITDELVDTIAQEEKIVPYLDIPIQHCNDNILKAMNRRDTKESIRKVFHDLRARIPGLVLRTSIIAGLPGEGEKEFEELCDFLREEKIERAGVFPFSPEEGTKAATMEHVPMEEAQRRTELLVDVQSDIIDEYNESVLGDVREVLCEGWSEEAQSFVGRSYAESVDIDGKIYFSANCDIMAGEFVNVRLTGTMDGELTGEAVE